MTDKLARDMERGRRAHELLKNTLLVEAFDTLQMGYAKLWAASNERDTEGRERLYMAQKVLQQVKQHFELVAADGKIAAHTLDEVRKRSGGLFRR